MEVIENINVCKKTKISKSTDELFSPPIPTSLLSISHNRPVRLVPCFVEVHHKSFASAVVAEQQH